MKKLSIIPFILMSLVAIPSWSETIDDLVHRNGLYYKKFTDVPFDGEIEGIVQGRIKNGKEEGPWDAYHENGQLWYKGAYSNGEYEGPWVEYHDNGQLSYKGAYKNGNKEGRWIEYKFDGSISTEASGVFKDGVKISD